MSINASAAASSSNNPSSAASAGGKKKKVTLSLAEVSQLLPNSPAPSTPAGSTSSVAAASSGSWADDYIELPEAPTGLARPPRPLSTGSYDSNASSSGRGGYSDRPGRGPPQGNRPGRGPAGRGSPFGSSQTGIDTSLPPAPVDPNRLPRNPPYVAFLGNLSHQIMETELGNTIQDLFQVKVTQVKIPEDKLTKQRRGFAYIYLSTVEDLMRVLEGSERTNILGRKIRLDIAEPHQLKESGRDFTSGSSSFAPAAASNEPSDWRAGARPVTPMAAPAENKSSGGSRGDEGGWRKTAQPITAVDPTAFESARKEQPKEADAAPSKIKSNPFGKAKPREMNLEARRNSTEQQ